MRFLIFSVVMFMGISQCTSNVFAADLNQIDKLCKIVREARSLNNPKIVNATEALLVSIAEDDADAFDMDNLEEQGVYTYMCEL